MNLNELHTNCRAIVWPIINPEDAKGMGLAEVSGDYTGYAPENFNFMAMESALVNGMHITAISEDVLKPETETDRAYVRRRYWARCVRLESRNAA